MQKVLLGIAIVAFTTFCGYLLGKKYRRRKDFFSQLYDFNERFLNEIAYYRRPLKEFFSKFSYKGDFEKLLYIYAENIDKQTLTADNMLENADFDFLRKEEKSVVGDYFYMLGKGDSSSQKTFFSSVKTNVTALRDTATAESKKYGDLFVKLGFLCGLLILILLI